MIKLVIFDMDGTLTIERSSWETFFRTYDHDPGPFNKKYASGELDEDGWAIANIKAILSSRPGLTAKASARAIVANTHLKKGIAQMISELKMLNIFCFILSSGMEPIAKEISSMAPVDLWMANWFSSDNNDRLEPIYLRRVTFMEKEVWVRRWREQFGLLKEEIVSVGDSFIDIGMFQSSGHSIAFDPADDKVARACDVVIEGNDTGLCLSNDPRMESLGIEKWIYGKRCGTEGPFKRFIGTDGSDALPAPCSCTGPLCCS